MAELVIDEFGMSFHSIYLSCLGDGIHLYYFTKFPYFIQEWNIGDVFNPTGRYELHPKDIVFLYVIF
jgi:hypothetical protein